MAASSVQARLVGLADFAAGCVLLCAAFLIASTARSRCGRLGQAWARRPNGKGCNGIANCLLSLPEAVGESALQMQPVSLQDNL